MPLQYGWSEEQLLIADSAGKLFADVFSSAALRVFMRDQVWPEQWRRDLGESGLLGICAPVEVGGAAQGATDALAILIAAGRRAAPWPIAESIAAAMVLSRSHPHIARAVMNAETVVAFATQSLVAVRQGDRWRLSGNLDAVPWANLARWLLLEVTAEGEKRLALLDLESAGITCETRKSIDPCCPIARVILNDVSFSSTDLLSGVERVGHLRTLFAAAEMLGAAQTSLNLAVDYMKVRKQFGQQIGRFQALKHIAANDALYIESMRLAIEYAAWAHDANADDAEMALHVAKQYCSQNARSVAEDSIQCHGGIGFTWDYDLHLYLRRILRLGASLGTAVEHREAIATALIEQFSRVAR